MAQFLDFEAELSGEDELHDEGIIDEETEEDRQFIDGSSHFNLPSDDAFKCSFETHEEDAVGMLKQMEERQKKRKREAELQEERQQRKSIKKFFAKPATQEQRPSAPAKELPSPAKQRQRKLYELYSGWYFDPKKNK